MCATDEGRENIRSRNMRAIRRRDTKPELIVRRHLHGAGLRFRVDVSGLAGRPDIALARWRVAILVHGCFWHRHPGCPLAATPATNPEFWREKFRRNVARDERVREALAAEGWRIAVIWECALRKPVAASTLCGLESWIRSGTEDTYSSDSDFPPA